MSRIFFFLPSLLLSALLAGGAAAESAIPPEVIAECNAAGNASSLPKCLKEGAIAFEMLALAREDRFYGEAAGPVIADCEERNDSFKTTWLCFETAAETAVETRGLIGLENIADACVSAISAPEAHEEIYSLYRQKREAHFPNEMFYGGDMFYPFKGCPAEPEKTSGAGSPVDTDEPADQGASKDITQARCDALDALETLISSRSADELRTLQAQISEKDHPDADSLAATLDIDPDAARELLAGTEPEKMQMVMLLGAFLREHHPPLYQQVIDNPDQISNSPASEFGGQLALGFVNMMVDEVEETYRSSCASS